MSIEALPNDLRQAVATITVNEQTAETVMAGLSPSQLNWQPKGGKAWSILQCLEHLNKSHNAYLKSMLPVLRAADPAKIPRRGDYVPGFYAGVFLSMLAPPVKVKVPAPSQIIPSSNLDSDKVLAAWLQTHKEIRQFATEAASVDLASLSMQNPFVKVLNVSLATALQILVTHEHRHLWQAGQVRRALEAAGA
jgi:hypothetical protein